jgi:hypothetical protein
MPLLPGPRTLALILSTTALGAAVLPAALAQSGPAQGSKATLADAKAHMDRGQALFVERKFAEAAAEFRAAYEVKPFSTFLYNEAVCHEKLGDRPEAIRLFEKYVDLDPKAPDRATVLARIARLKEERDRSAPASDAGPEGDAGAATDDAAPAVPMPVPVAASIDEMRSIVVVESVPDEAPVEIWFREDPASGPFAQGGPNKGWTKVVAGTTPLTQSLPLGTYHVVLPKFRDYRATETDVTVAAATISHFKANLAQGAFYGVVKVRSFDGAREIRGPHVLLKGPGEKSFRDRGQTPYQESLEAGTYVVRVEAPGFKPRERTLEVEHGKIDEQRFELERSDDGMIRVEVTGADAATVYVDDRPIGIHRVGAKVEVGVPAGVHRLRVEADDRKTWKTDVDVPRGKVVVAHADLKPSVPRGAAWSTAIASAVFLGGGIFLGVQSNALRDDLEAARAAGRLDQEDPRIKRGQYFAIGADAAFAVSGLLGLVAIYNFVKDPLPPSRGWTDKPTDFDLRAGRALDERRGGSLATRDVPARSVQRWRLVPVTTVSPGGGLALTGLGLAGEF